MVSVNLPVNLYIRQPWFLVHSGLKELLAISSKPGYLFALTLRNRGLRNTAPLNVSYARQDYTPGSVILPVILYIRQPWFLLHLVLGEVLAIPSKPGFHFALTLRTRGP